MIATPIVVVVVVVVVEVRARVGLGEDRRGGGRGGVDARVDDAGVARRIVVTRLRTSSTRRIVCLSKICLLVTYTVVRILKGVRHCGRVV